MKNLKRNSNSNTLHNKNTKVNLKFWILCSIIGLMIGPLYAYFPDQYTQTYRPQYHFSANSGWIGDPDGLVRYNNKYHLFWWGHAISNDLVYWEEKNWPMQGDNSAFDYYSGAVVVDKNNSSGFKIGTYPPMVALFTNHNKNTGLEAPAISISNDYLSDYTNFYLYNYGTPIMPIAMGFRDPSVFWDATHNQWVMTISANAHDKTVEFYRSTNLKNWQKINNSFGPIGSRENWWECTDLIQLPVDGNKNNMKWVLLCSTSARVQYFYGTFDGVSGFNIDPACHAYLKNGNGIQGSVFADFETTSYAGWTLAGTAFGSAPASSTLSGQQYVFGYLGNKFVNSYNNGDGSTGTLTSAPFTITKNCINFLISGGNHPGQTCINLIVDGTVVRTTTGRDSEILKWAGWDVSPLKGKTAKIQIVDNNTGGWGHINVDHIVFSDVLWNNNLEHALIADYGRDFYAARTFRDYDNVEDRTVMLGWMGNWDYSGQTPTSWGKGHQSLPRELALKTFADGIRLVQKPIPALEKLRNGSVTVNNKSIQNTQTLTEFTPDFNYYEIEAVFNVTAGANFGLNLCVNGTNKVVLGYDAASSNLYLDRTKSGNTSFSYKFPDIAYAPLTAVNGQIKLHIFVDQSSIEVFGNDGQSVISSLIYPSPDSKTIQLFSNNGSTTLESLVAYNLKSIWKTYDTGVPVVSEKNEDVISIYPNPLQSGEVLKIKITDSYKTNKKMQLRLFSLEGKQLLEKTFSSSNESVLELNNNFSKGAYIVEIESDKKVKQFKLLIK